MKNNIVESILRLLKSEFVKFAFVGGISAVIEFSLLILFVEKLSIDYLIGNVVAFALTNIVTYILSKRYVFNAASSVNKAQEAGLFFLCLLGGLLVNQIVLWAFVEFTSLDYRIAKVIAIAITVIWNFFTRKHLVFRNRAVATQQSAATDYSEDTL
ncbi:MAG TPA: GtrA family protein [Ohtaekwangia sp.]|uniref:GtrA family protein n=1 Tax=Ohtaekwangia sp. TaxID=2066019 RepID=UPI002F93A590